MLRLFHFAALAAAITAFACTARAHEVEQGPASFATQIQIERFAALDSNPATITTIKADAPNACAYLNVAYIKGAAHGQVRSHGHTVVVTEILVIAVDHGQGWQRLAPIIQYTLFPVVEGAA